MKGIWKKSLAICAMTAFGSIASAQGQPPQPGGAQPRVITASSTESTTRPVGVAARVNNQPVLEVAVARALKAVPAEERAKARPEIVQFLVDNVLIDQYLEALKIAVDPKDVEKHLAEFKDDVKKHNQEYGKVLQNLMLTDTELREQIAGQLRWEKFVAQQASPETLKKMFEANVDVFDGSMVRARHIQVTPTADTPTAKQEAETRIRQIQAAINKAVADALAKLPPTTTAEQREERRMQFLEDAFAQMAKKYSSCASSKDGGDLNFFPRAGAMVEPFSKAAFGLKPGQMSDLVLSQMGYHLILVTGRKPGTTPDYDNNKGVKDAVREYYEGKLREAVTQKMRQQSKIEIVGQ